MAYTAGNLTQLAYGVDYSLYSYNAGTDTLATVLASGYFNNDDDNLGLRVGDQIKVVAADGQVNIRVDTITASTGVVTTEMGAGEGVWLVGEIADVSTAASIWFAAPFDGFIRRFKTVLHGAITNADAAIAVKLATVTVTGATVTVATAGSAAGIVDQGTATALNAISEGVSIEVSTNGGSTTARKLTVMVECVPG